MCGRLAISLLELEMIVVLLLQIMRPSLPLQVCSRLHDNKERVPGISAFGLENDQNGKPSDLKVPPGLTVPYGNKVEAPFSVPMFSEACESSSSQHLRARGPGVAEAGLTGAQVAAGQAAVSVTQSICRHGALMGLMGGRAASL